MFQLLQIQSYKQYGEKSNTNLYQKLSCVVMGATKFGTEIYVKTAGVFYVKFRLVTKLEQQYVMNKKMF